MERAKTARRAVLGITALTAAAWAWRALGRRLREAGDLTDDWEREPE